MKSTNFMTMVIVVLLMVFGGAGLVSCGSTEDGGEATCCGYYDGPEGKGLLFEAQAEEKGDDGEMVEKTIYLVQVSKNKVVRISNPRTGGSIEGKLVIPESIKYKGYRYTITKISEVWLSMTRPLRFPEDLSNVTEIVIPETVEEIQMIFDGAGIEHLEIPNSVKTFIGFINCKNLKTISLPEGLKEFGFMWNCPNLESIELPNGIETIKGRAFLDCINLKNIKLPENLKEIGFEAFRNCVNLESIELPNGIETIERGAFFGCTSLKYVRIPESVSYLGRGVFEDCSSELVVSLSRSTHIYEAEKYRNFKTEYYD